MQLVQQRKYFPRDWIDIGWERPPKLRRWAIMIGSHRPVSLGVEYCLTKWFRCATRAMITCSPDWSCIADLYHHPWIYTASTMATKSNSTRLWSNNWKRLPRLMQSICTTQHCMFNAQTICDSHFWRIVCAANDDACCYHILQTTHGFANAFGHCILAGNERMRKTTFNQAICADIFGDSSAHAIRAHWPQRPWGHSRDNHRHAQA